jgi:hypothetical protein
MKPSDRTRQGPTVRCGGERVVWRCLPSASTLPSASLGVRPSPQRPGGTVVMPALPPVGLAPGTGGVRRISIAEKARLVVPSN